jgi:hypothetical protein
MEQNQTPLEKILMVLGIFRLEKEQWPLDAAELQSFAKGLGKPLDFSVYHQFRFIPKSKVELILDFCLLPLNNEWALGGQAGVRIKREIPEMGHTLPLEVRIQTLIPQKVETRSYCLLEEPRLSGKRSA